MLHLDDKIHHRYQAANGVEDLLMACSLHTGANSANFQVNSKARRVSSSAIAMSHHLFLLSPTDSPLYSLTHYSTKPTASVTSPLTSNLPTWSTSAFAGTLTALTGATSAPQTHGVGGGSGVGGMRTGGMGGGQDRHVIQMIANAALDAIEDVMRRDGAMYVVLSPVKIILLLSDW